MAKKRGLNIPIVYNTSAYENISSLQLLDGLIDIYLPDLKYFSNALGKYSQVENYFYYSTRAIEEMYRQVGKVAYNKDGTLRRGVLIRHLVLPGHMEDSKKIMEYLYNKYQNNVIVSLMNQYTPIRKLEYPNLNHKVSSREYNNLIDYAYDLGFRNCFVQDEESQNTSFIPSFKGDSLI